MPFEAHKTRRLWPANVYGKPREEPHHVHLAPCAEGCAEEHEHVPVCTDHRLDACPVSHWEGGRPDPNHPHHVEFDGSTGRWGYLRLGTQEIADLRVLAAFELDQQEARDEKVKERIGLIREKAKQDPAFYALAEHLGIALEG